VAIKEVRPEVAAVFGASRFLREFGIFASLQHPHVLTLIDSGDAAGMLDYVMPLVEGESLRERLRRCGRLGITDTARILRDGFGLIMRPASMTLTNRDTRSRAVSVGWAIMAPPHASYLDSRAHSSWSLV
jgi:serine/threonine protein kinase